MQIRDTAQKRQTEASVESLVELERATTEDIPVDELLTATLRNTETTTYTELSKNERKRILDGCMQGKTVEYITEQSDDKQTEMLASAGFQMGDVIEPDGITVLHFDCGGHDSVTAVRRTQSFEFDTFKTICGADTLPETLYKQVPIVVRPNGSVSIRADERSLRQAAGAPRLLSALPGLLISLAWLSVSFFSVASGHPLLGLLSAFVCCFSPLFWDSEYVQSLFFAQSRIDSEYMRNFSNEKAFFELLQQLD